MGLLHYWTCLHLEFPFPFSFPLTLDFIFFSSCSCIVLYSPIHILAVLGGVPMNPIGIGTVCYSRHSHPSYPIHLQIA